MRKAREAPPPVGGRAGGGQPLKACKRLHPLECRFLVQTLPSGLLAEHRQQVPAANKQARSWGHLVPSSACWQGCSPHPCSLPASSSTRPSRASGSASMVVPRAAICTAAYKNTHKGQ